MDGESVQERHAPNSICFGCGPANEEGLRIRSFPIEGGLEMTFETSAHHQAFPGMINGGIIGTLLDCHGNWTAAMAIMADRGEEEAPCTVTARYTVKLRSVWGVTNSIKYTLTIKIRFFSCQGIN